MAQRLEAAGWALCFGHGPAGGFFVCPSILLKSIVEEGCDRERSNKRCTCAAAAACARAPRARECACVPAVLLVLREDAGAAEKGHYRVRHFAGVVAFPVVKRQRVDMATAVYDGVARARRAGARRALQPLGDGWAGARVLRPSLRVFCPCTPRVFCPCAPRAAPLRSATLWLLLCCYRVLTTRVHVLM